MFGNRRESLPGKGCCISMRLAVMETGRRVTLFFFPPRVRGCVSGGVSRIIERSLGTVCSANSRSSIISYANREVLILFGRVFVRVFVRAKL